MVLPAPRCAQIRGTTSDLQTYLETFADLAENALANHDGASEVLARDATYA
jgi:hypothetical protein